MRIVAEENVDNDIVVRLRRDGHDVRYVSELSSGILDEKVLVLGGEDDWILMTVLLTADTDFEKLLLRQRHVRRGIVLYRRRNLFRSKTTEIISQVIAKYGDKLLQAFSVITDKAARIRKL